ncbi:hypothetical protein K469DRAFT_721347 [Zopfia rhizophila CBS 207.26]|uniref:Uncharacterized protein n=1 Tax=Zopfia rhizophila CBS 207.26 TaxID=1314779 RepID=A0A6A6EFI1_9PEZI|nr:hypothetical protein K469DRAFT_721347 [Zopfia rhizophila CBS 207.26]
MNLTHRVLSKQKFRTFNCSYSSQCKTFISHQVLVDRQHPLHSAHQRRQAERERLGLWWHVTVGANSSKTKVVRSWLRRRLRNAFIEELKKRGFDQDGRVTNKREERGRRGMLEELPKLGETGSLKGSLRLHANNALVSAKYEDVRQETAKVVDALVQGLKAEEDNSKNVMDRRQIQPQSNICQMQWGRKRVRRISQSSKLLEGRRKNAVAIDT